MSSIPKNIKHFEVTDAKIIGRKLYVPHKDEEPELEIIQPKTIETPAIKNPEIVTLIPVSQPIEDQDLKSAIALLKAAKELNMSGEFEVGTIKMKINK